MDPYRQENIVFRHLCTFLSQKKVNLMTDSVKFRVGGFDVDPTRNPRGEWVFPNQNPTVGPLTVGFSRVVHHGAINTFDKFSNFLSTLFCNLSY